MGKQAERTRGKRANRPGASARWKLEDAKARFSEVVRHAREEGAQPVTVRGQDAIVVVSVEELERLAPKSRGNRSSGSWKACISRLDPERNMDRGRDVQL